jgi:preprotein translocase subunit SecF
MISVPRFHFLKYRGIAGLLSLSMIVGFFGYASYLYMTRGYVFTYSIDFTGGTQTLFRFSQPVSTAKVREVLEKAGWQGTSTREFTARNEVLVRVQAFSNDAKGLGEKMGEALRASMPGVTVDILQSEGVGAGVGAELRSNAFRAVLIALLAMLIYIAITFWSFSFAVGAVIALFHDPILVLATFLVLNHEISINVIGAILAVIGYSINDTIVIFAQIRHNIKKMTNASLYEIVDLSVNQTLRRTVLTSFATLLTVLSMFLLGGESLRDFSLAMLVGIAVGTYSSIYIASPVMMMLYKKE